MNTLGAGKNLDEILGLYTFPYLASNQSKIQSNRQVESWAVVGRRGFHDCDAIAGWYLDPVNELVIVSAGYF